MKFKFTLLLSILSSFVAFSQTTYSSDTVAVTATECNSNEYKAEIQMTNNSSTQITYNWSGDTMINNTKWATRPGFCDKDGCKTLPNSGSITLAAAEKFKVYTLFSIVDDNLKKVNGYAKTKITVSEIGKPDKILFFEFRQQKCTSSNINEKENNSFINFSNSTLSVSNDLVNKRIVITNINGLTILDALIKSNNQSITNLSKGVYIANVISNGEIVNTRKFIVE
jgi:hypothetical protein